MTGKRPTSFDIAALAGVSQATVSRALSQGGVVSEAVRQRVVDAAAQLNYTVDVNARKLRSKKINTIAVLISEDMEKSDSPINPFFMPLIGSILKYAGSKGYDVLVSLQKQSDNWGSDYGHARRADGIIFLGYNDYDTYTKKVAVLGEMGEPWVLWGPVIPEHPNLVIGSDNEGGAYSAVKHLIGLGRRRIAFLGEPSASHLEYKERFEGYVRALTEAGITPDPELMIDCFISREDGVAAIERLMSEGVAFDAVFAVADLLAVGAIQQLLRAGRSVPKDVSVMGFDDLWVCTCTSPMLSTVRQDTTEAAHVLVDALDVLISGHPVELKRIPTQLIIRESCGG
ncbi:substrate-binding domain-containing protein [Asticcacaulis sp. ZE23SCel15]|uniref:LacI family DNA-binding transcriptional regulator n=1 Tax=Asticcacaulis sp. ZE23SCel15 TaxID=3059027 RepID=UPI00265FF872|nr:substrate-binding domain-containing protein [Asticcacaulis sp. ZE23SCel15]WKL56048.1 substrate-binding domain-containing protein [Asticcacaulis sp. ZE23SCel15]